MPFYHFSRNRIRVGTLLVGLKSAHKSAQRVGQRQVDEEFEAVRKARFPNAPSLFTSLWVTDGPDPSIPRKAFIEDPSLVEGYLYHVEPRGAVYQVEPHWEVLACRAVTQSGLAGAALRAHIGEMAERFWRPDLVEAAARDYLCAEGAVVIEELRRMPRSEVVT